MTDQHSPVTDGVAAEGMRWYVVHAYSGMEKAAEPMATAATTFWPAGYSVVAAAGAVV